jgi:hypothetical protein
MSLLLRFSGRADFWPPAQGHAQGYRLCAGASETVGQGAHARKHLKGIKFSLAPVDPSFRKADTGFRPPMMRIGLRTGPGQ